MKVGNSLLAAVSLWVMHLLSATGLLGVAIAMALESACVPLPSEVILPFAGFLVASGRVGFWGATLAGLIGGTVGSYLAYLAGRYGGRPFLHRYGRYILLRQSEVERAERWFQRHGEAVVFFGRLLPVVRTFISLPAGIAEMNTGRFLLYTVLGSIPWTLALVYAGTILGQHWREIGPLFHYGDFLVGALAVALVVWWLVRRRARAV